MPTNYYPPLNLTADQLEQLSGWADLYDTLAEQVPPPEGERYTASEFIEWLRLEFRARSSDHALRHRRGPAIDRWRLRTATG